MTQNTSPVSSEFRFTREECHQLLNIVANNLPSSTLTESGFRNLCANACAELLRFKKIYVKLQESGNCFDIRNKDVVILLILMYDGASAMDPTAVQKAQQTYAYLFPDVEEKRSSVKKQKLDPDSPARGKFVGKIKSALGVEELTSSDQIKLCAYIANALELNLISATAEDIRKAARECGITGIQIEVTDVTET